MAITVVNLSDPVQTFVTKTNSISSNLGDVSQLTSGDSNVVDAINALAADVGNVAALSTGDNVVAAVNSLYTAQWDSAEIRAISKTAFGSNQDGKILYDSNGTGLSIFSLDSSVTNSINTKSPTASPTFTGTPAAPTASYDTNSTQLATTAFVHDVLPYGTIVMWYGLISSIPAGWALCDGNNSTPNLTDKFVICAKADSVSKAQTYVTGAYTQTGGTKDLAVPYHSHGAGTNNPSLTGAIAGISQSFVESGTCNGVFSKSNGPQVNSTPISSDPQLGGTASLDVTHSHNVSVNAAHNTNWQGTSGASNATNANLPPYYALAYIMKTSG